MIDRFGHSVEFDTFAEADRFLRQEGFSARHTQTEDHYASYMKDGATAEVGPGSISGSQGNWRAQITKSAKAR